MVSWYKASGYIRDFFQQPLWTIALLRQSERWFSPRRPLEKQFFSLDRSTPGDQRPIAFVFGLRPRRAEQIRGFLPDYRVYFVPNSVVPETVAHHCTRLGNQVTFFIWAYRERPGIEALARERGIRICRVEDGFVLSRSLGARKDKSVSLLFDERGVHFAADGPTQLEDLLNSYDFDADPQLLAKARACLERIIENRISKYNYLPPIDAAQIYGPKTSRRVLVIGQSERDASIIFGSPRIKLNNDLVRLAATENPDAEILYKIHPDVLTKHVPKESDPRAVQELCRVLDMPLSIPDALQSIDRVYVMTSLSGFEALMRGIQVTVTGTPFYAGWGLTDDRIPLPRRRRRLSLEQLFAVAYLVYPVYRHPQTNERIGLEQALELLIGAPG